MGATARIGGNGAMGPAQKDPWLAWAALVIPGFASGITWPLTVALPFVHRVAIAAATALVIFAVVYVIVKGLPR